MKQSVTFEEQKYPGQTREQNLTETFVSNGSDEEKLLNEVSMKTEKSESSIDLHLRYVTIREEEILAPGKYRSKKIAR